MKPIQMMTVPSYSNLDSINSQFDEIILSAVSYIEKGKSPTDFLKHYLSKDCDTNDVSTLFEEVCVANNISGDDVLKMITEEEA